MYVNTQLSRLHSRPASSAADAGDTSFIHPFIHSFIRIGFTKCSRIFGRSQGVILYMWHDRMQDHLRGVSCSRFWSTIKSREELLRVNWCPLFVATHFSDWSSWTYFERTCRTRSWTSDISRYYWVKLSESSNISLHYGTNSTGAHVSFYLIIFLQGDSNYNYGKNAWVGRTGTKLWIIWELSCTWRLPNML